MIETVVDLSKLPLLIVSPDFSEFQTAVDTWNAFLNELREYESHPVDWRLAVKNLYNGEVEFNPHRSRVLADGIVESTRMPGHDGNGNWQLYTRALINHDFLVVKGPTFRYPNVGRVETYIEEQFELRHH